MTARTAGRLAWGLCGLTCTLLVAGLVLAVLEPSSAGPLDERFPGGRIPVALFELATLGAAAVVAALVASHRPRNPIGWLLCNTPAWLAFALLADHAWWWIAADRPGGAAFAELVAWLATWPWVPTVVPMSTLLPLLFTTGGLPMPRWRVVGWAAVGAGLVLLFAEAFRPGPLEGHGGVSNPVGIAGLPAAAVEGIAFAVFAVATLGSIGSVILRFRRAGGVERQQIKFVAAAATAPVPCSSSGTCSEARRRAGSCSCSA
jgi:hypothetical protein